LDDPGDPQFTEALQEVAGNPGLAEWFAEEQAFDQAIAAHLAAVPAPFGLKTRILARDSAASTSRYARWIFGLAGAAALLFLLSQVAEVWRRPVPESTALPAYANEMVSFIKVPPSLEMKSGDLGAIKSWLTQKETVLPNIPPNLAALAPVGCRILSFRQHDVTLICFHQGSDKLAHLFVVDRAALPGVKPGDAVIFQREGEWMTATWAEKDQVYTIAVQGGESAVQDYLPSA
jgi:hypothetical protein